jgi:hypothetical protein
MWSKGVGRPEIPGSRLGTGQAADAQIIEEMKLAGNNEAHLRAVMDSER